MAFNYKSYSNINNRLQESNDGKGIKSHKETINAVLDRTGGNEKPSSALNVDPEKPEFKPSDPISKRMDAHKGLYPTQRNKRVFDGTQDVGNMAVYNDKKFRDAIKKAKENKTKGNKAYQLQDNPQRYEETSSVPMHNDTQEDIKNMGKKNNIKLMQGFRENEIKEKSNILKESDAILFNMFLKIAADDRTEPNETELNIIKEISDLKNIILS